MINWFSKEKMLHEKKIANLKNELENNKKKIKTLCEDSRKMGNALRKDSILKEIDKLTDRNEEIVKLLDNVSTYTDHGIETIPYTPDPFNFSLGDASGRIPVDANRSHVVFDNYTNNAIAEIVEEGTESTPREYNSSILNTDIAESIVFDDVVKMRFNRYNDTPYIQDMIDHDHAQAIINAENKKAFEVLVESKNAVPISAKNIQEEINKKLCAKAKKSTMIFVNKSGFALLDVDVNGVPLVTKDSNGRFIYKNKYEIQEVDEKILPNNSDGSPIALVGDIFHVIKFFLVRDNSYYGEIFLDHMDRTVKKEIITLRTKSDEAYFIAKLSA